MVLFTPLLLFLYVSWLLIGCNYYLFWSLPIFNGGINGHFAAATRREITVTGGGHGRKEVADFPFVKDECIVINFVDG